MTTKQMKFLHVRPLVKENANHGGVTIAYQFEGNVVQMSWAVCSIKDQYDKYIGRTNAANNMDTSGQCFKDEVNPVTSNYVEFDMVDYVQEDLFNSLDGFNRSITSTLCSPSTRNDMQIAIGAGFAKALIDNIKSVECFNFVVIEKVISEYFHKNVLPTDRMAQKSLTQITKAK